MCGEMLGKPSLLCTWGTPLSLQSVLCALSFAFIAFCCFWFGEAECLCVGVSWSFKDPQGVTSLAS